MECGVGAYTFRSRQAIVRQRHAPNWTPRAAVVPFSLSAASASLQRCHTHTSSLSPIVLIALWIPRVAWISLWSYCQDHRWCSQSGTGAALLGFGPAKSARENRTRRHANASNPTVDEHSALKNILTEQQHPPRSALQPLGRGARTQQCPPHPPETRSTPSPSRSTSAMVPLSP